MTEPALHTIRAFANLPMHQFQAAQAGTLVGLSPQDTNLYQAALDALVQNNEWLQDHALVQNIFVRLEALDSHSSETSIKTGTIFQKISGQINLKLHDLLKSNTIRIRISNRDVIHVPQSALFASRANLHVEFVVKDDELDFSDLASPETLAHFVTYLCTGEADSVSHTNAFELYYLARSFGLPDLSMICVEHILKSCDKWDSETNAAQPLTNQEANLEKLLKELEGVGLSISKSATGIASVKISGGLEPQKWEYLAKFHQYFPVTHLTLKQTNKENLDQLSIFVEHNPKIVSLELGSVDQTDDKDQDVDDSYLEELAQNLPNLNSFYIRAHRITTIPSAITDRAETLICDNCLDLTAIQAPAATTLTCKLCPALTTVDAPVAKMAFFSFCSALTTLEAPVAQALTCRRCHVLATVNAPLATILDYTYCNALISIDAPSAIDLGCLSCPVLVSISAPLATKLCCEICPLLTMIHAPSAEIFDTPCCAALKEIYAPSARHLSCSDCLSLTTIYAPLVTRLFCNTCCRLSTINAPSATKLMCHDCHSLKAVNAPLLTELITDTRPSLTSLNAPLLAMNLLALPSLQTGTLAPMLVWTLDKMPEVRRLNQAEGYEALCQQMLDERNQERELCHALILECQFKAKLLRNENIRGYIDPLAEKLQDPATAEGVIGEVADFSRWAREVSGHEHLAQWLYNLKEEIRRTVEVVHTQATNRFLLREQYEASREAQNNALHKDQAVINLSLFLNNEGLRRDLRHLYANIRPVELRKMHNALSRALDMQLPELYPSEEDHFARKGRILSLIQRVSETKDYDIDPEGVGTRLAAVVKSICTYRTARQIGRNIAYLRSLLEAIEEGAELCQNRAADALHKSEEIYFQKKFKGNRPALYGIELMRWKRRFLEQFVRLETMPAVFGRDQGAGWDIEMIMTNSQTYNELLDLNMDIEGILYMDDIKRYLTERGLDGQEIANPQELFKTLLEQTTSDKVLDLCLCSPAIQKLHGVSAAVQETPQDVREKAGIQLAAWGKPLVEGEEESKDSLDKLGDMLNGYREMDGFADLEALFDASMTNLRSVYAAGSAYDDDKEIEIIHSLQIALSNMHDAYRQRVFQDNSPGGFRDSVIKDLIEARYLVLPELDEGQLSLNYPEPSSLVVDPNAVIEATLQLNVEEWPSEFFDAQ